MRRRKRIWIPPEVLEVMEVLDLILDHHALGAAVLQGAEKWPSSPELADLIRYVHGGERGDLVQGGERIPEGQRMLETIDRTERILRENGGAEAFVRACRAFRKVDPHGWGLVRDHSESVQPGGGPKAGPGELPASWEVAERWGYHPATVRRRRDDIVFRIARDIRQTAVGWDLSKESA